MPVPMMAPRPSAVRSSSADGALELVLLVLRVADERVDGLGGEQALPRAAFSWRGHGRAPLRAAGDDHDGAARALHQLERHVAEHSRGDAPAVRGPADDQVRVAAPPRRAGSRGPPGPDGPPRSPRRRPRASRPTVRVDRPRAAPRAPSAAAARGPRARARRRTRPRPRLRSGSPAGRRRRPARAGRPPPSRPPRCAASESPSVVGLVPPSARPRAARIARMGRCSGDATDGPSGLLILLVGHAALQARRRLLPDRRPADGDRRLAEAHRRRASAA